MKPGSTIIIITAVLASLLEIIDSSIVNVAIPTMMGNLGVTLDEISWVSTGYMIANSIVLPIAAWIGTRLGRKMYFTSAIGLFTLASFACGIAPNLGMLVFFRIIQGLAGGALLPTSQTLIQEQFPPEQAGFASAVFGMSVMIGPALGPTLGGYLTDNLGWRSIFNINVPLGLFAAIMSWLYVGTAPHHAAAQAKSELDAADPTTVAAPPAKKNSIDIVGLMLLCIGVGCFQFILERGETEGWWDSNLIRVNGILAATGIVSFIWWELKIENPIMNLRLFKESIIRSGTLLMLAMGVMVYALTFIVPVFVNRIIHLTATQTGELFIPGSILTAFVMYFVGKAMRFVDPRYLIVVGLGVAELALVTMSQFTTATGANDVYLPLILRGLGTAMLFIPINGLVLGQFRGEKLGQVAGMMNFFRQMGGSIGIASLSTLLTRFSAQNYVDLMSKVDALNPVAYQEYVKAQGLTFQRLSSAVGIGTRQDVAIKTLYERVSQQVFVLSFSQLCYVIMFIFALALIPLWTIKVKGKVEVVLDAH